MLAFTIDASGLLLDCSCLDMPLVDWALGHGPPSPPEMTAISDCHFCQIAISTNFSRYPSCCPWEMNQSWTLASCTLLGLAWWHQQINKCFVVFLIWNQQHRAKCYVHQKVQNGASIMKWSHPNKDCCGWGILTIPVPPAPFTMALDNLLLYNWTILQHQSIIYNYSAPLIVITPFHGESSHTYSQEWW